MEMMGLLRWSDTRLILTKTNTRTCLTSFNAGLEMSVQNPAIYNSLAALALLPWQALQATLVPDILHWHKAAKEGERVPIDRITMGVNLMRDTTRPE
jgi:hypothetical protein